MHTMNFAVLFLVVGVLSFRFKNADSTPTFNFNAATFSKIGYLTSQKDSWSISGTLLILDSDAADFGTRVSIIEENLLGREICLMDLQSCQALEDTNKCFCSGKDNSVSGETTYSLEVKSLLVHTLSSLKSILAKLDPNTVTDAFGNPVSTTIVQTMPEIYDQIVLTYQISGYSEQPVSTTQTITIHKGEETTLTFCANKLNGVFTVIIEIGGKTETENNKPCVNFTRVYDFSSTSYTATLKYNEEVPGRTGSYIVTIKREICATTNPCTGRKCVPTLFSNYTCDCTQLNNGTSCNNVTCGSQGSCSRNCNHPDEQVCIYWEEEMLEITTDGTKDQNPSSARCNTVSCLVCLFYVMFGVLW